MFYIFYIYIIYILYIYFICFSTCIDNPKLFHKVIVYHKCVSFQLLNILVNTWYRQHFLMCISLIINKVELLNVKLIN